MGYAIILYQTGSDAHKMDKDLTAVGSYDCDLKAPVDAENPEITLHAGNVTANYAYIPAFGRYYSITPITKNNVVTTYQGVSDPLMSFKDGIKASPAVISRNPWHFDLYLPDNQLPIEARTAAAVIKFPNNHFSGQNNCYILTTLGGGS